MNKQELLSTYTAEQLAEMVVKFDIASEMSAKKIYNLEIKINNLEEENGRLQEKVDAYNKFFPPRCTKEAKEMMDHNDFRKVMIVTYEQWHEKGKEPKAEVFCWPKEYAEKMRELINIDTREIRDDCLRFSIEGLQRYLEIEEPKKQYEAEKAKQRIANLEKAIKTATEKIADLANENMKLQCERNDYESKAKALEVERMRVRLNEFSDFLPTEPIKIADMLIDNAAGVYENYVEDFAKAYSGQLVIGNPCEDVRRQTLSYLRQIAEHLLVYCNANGEVEE